MGCGAEVQLNCHLRFDWSLFPLVGLLEFDLRTVAGHRCLAVDLLFYCQSPNAQRRLKNNNVEVKKLYWQIKLCTFEAAHHKAEWKERVHQAEKSSRGWNEGNQDRHISQEHAIWKWQSHIDALEGDA